MTKSDFYGKLNLKEYKPIVDYVEGRLSVVDFKKMFNNDISLRRTLSHPMIKKYKFLHKNDYNICNKLDELCRLYKNWDCITLRHRIQVILSMFLDNFGVEYHLYPQYSNDMDVLCDIQPPWFYATDSCMDFLVYKMPQNLSKEERIEWCKPRLKRLFKCDKEYPQWVNQLEWPIVNGKPLVFSHQETISDVRDFTYYYFYDPETNDQTVVEQFY